MRQLRNIHQMVDPEIDLAEEHRMEVGKQEETKEVVTLFWWHRSYITKIIIPPISLFWVSNKLYG